MKRQKVTIGAILEIKIENSYYVYAQILDGGYVFFDFKTGDRLKDYNILNSVSKLFILGVYKEVITKGIWIKVATLPIRDSLKVIPMQYIQDIHNPNKFSLYDPKTGDITESTREACVGLERCAVWTSNHVEDRIRDYYLGVSNKWLELLKIK